MLPVKVPFLDLKRDTLAEQTDIREILAAVAASGQYLFGPRLAQFESDLAEHLSLSRELVKVCHSGTDALTLALLAAGVGTGHEVITPANTAVATAAAIVATGARPIFCDVNPASGLLNIEDCLTRITRKTRAIIPVHLYGNAFDLEELRDALNRGGHADICLIEDAAQAQGATFKGKMVGTMGDYGAFSFFPTKNLGAMGDGGAVACKREESARRIGALRFYGQTERNLASIPYGINSRMDEFQAAILSYRLGRFHLAQKKKIALMEIYREGLRSLPLRLPAVSPYCVPAWHLCVAITDREEDRDPLRKFLAEKGVETLVHYPTPLHQHPAFLTDVSLPGAEKLAKQVLSLPFSGFHSLKEIETVIEAVRGYFRS
ncbi:MAG: DegT/DnrJ/EryC1/StrS family aminotransferase [Bacteriovoracia bacterium]